MAHVRETAVKGALWFAGQRIANRILGQLFSIILLRLLTPKDYGLLAMGVVLIGVLDLFAHLAMEPAIIQRSEADDEFLSTAFWANMAVGVLMFGVAVVASPFVAGFFKEPGILAIVVALSLRFIIDAGAATQSALLARAMAFRQLSLRTLLGTVTGGCIGVGMALAGFGVWSLVAQILGARIAALAAIQLLSRWRPRRVFSPQRLRELWSFAGPLVIAQLLGYAIRNTDNVLIGRYLGSAALGVYALGYNLFIVPITDLGAPVSHVLFATLSRAQDDTDQLGRIFLSGSRYVAMLTIPAMVGLAVVAPVLVEVVFGHKWLPAAPVISILALAGSLRFTHMLGPSVLQATGRTDFQMRWALWAAFLYLPAFGLGLRWGVTGVASGYLAATVVLTAIYYPSLTRAIGVPLGAAWAALAPSLLASAAMAAAVLLARASLDAAMLPKAVTLVVLVALGSIVYLTLMALTQRPWLRRLVGLLRGHH